MARMIVAFLMAPLLVSVAYFGGIAVVAYPLFLIVALALGLPIFLGFHRLGWLAWWHAASVGIACSTVGIAIDISSPFRAQIYGPQIAVSYAAMGFIVGVLFWFVGLFRNERFPTIPRAIPKSI